MNPKSMSCFPLFQKSMKGVLEKKVRPTHRCPPALPKLHHHPPLLLFSFVIIFYVILIVHFFEGGEADSNATTKRHNHRSGRGGLLSHLEKVARIIIQNKKKRKNKTAVYVLVLDLWHVCLCFKFFFMTWLGEKCTLITLYSILSYIIIVIIY